MEGQIEVSDEQASLLQILRNLVEAGEASLRAITAVGHYQHATALLVGQMVASGQAVHVLCVAGRANQARPNARSMVENLINTHFIALDPDTRAKRFWIYRPIPHAQVAEARYRNFGITDELEEIRAQAAEAKKLLSGLHWASGTSIRARAKECSMLPIWELYYSEGSAFSHGDASTWNAFTTEDGKAMKFGPSPEGIEAVAEPATSALFGGLFLLSHVFEDRKLNNDLGRIAATLPERTKRIDLQAHFELVRSKK